MKSGIYLITNVVNHKVYVGSSKNMRKRKCEHFDTLDRRKHVNFHLQRAHNSYGFKVFLWEILEYCCPEDLAEREDWWMILLDSRNPVKGYNLRTAEHKEHSAETRAKMSTAAKGRIISKEQREKMSVARKGKKTLPCSEETKAKISAANTGRKHTERSRANMSVAHKGKNLGHTVSDETRKKISAALMGKPLSEEHRAKVSTIRIGMKHSEETKAKMSASHKGMKGKKHSEETKAKMSAARKDMKRSEQSKANMSVAKKVK